MADITELERDFATLKAGRLESDVGELQRKLDTVKSTLADTAPAEDKVRWLSEYLSEPN